MDVTPIIYHYPASPYAEKVRLLAGYLGVPWRSCDVPIQPPRDTLALLAGGYRRIPVMQFGADIFCDTAIICDEIIALAERPLAPCDDEALALARVAETEVFFAAIRQNTQFKIALGLVLRLGIRGMLAFARDRRSFAQGHGAAALSPEVARTVFRDFLVELDARLGSDDFVGGESPCLSDFCCYHPIFLAKGFNAIKDSQLSPAVRSWVKRMAVLGWGPHDPVTGSTAIDVAKQSDPRILTGVGTNCANVGQWVTVTPTDTGRVPVTGTLVSQDERRTVIARRSDDVGLCHVHFPRLGFECLTIS